MLNIKIRESILAVFISVRHLSTFRLFKDYKLPRDFQKHCVKRDLTVTNYDINLALFDHFFPVIACVHVLILYIFR